MTDDKEPNGIECFECMEVFGEEDLDTPVGDYLAPGGEVCPQCESDNLGPVLISPCPSPEKNSVGFATCNDLHHHHGRHDHVETIQR